MYYSLDKICITYRKIYYESEIFREGMMQLTNEYLVALGYDDISKRYEALHSTY